MYAVDRQSRQAQLLDLRATDPIEVVSLYRRAVGLNQRSMLPGGMDLDSLVESILDYEAASGRFSEQPLGLTQVGATL